MKLFKQFIIPLFLVLGYLILVSYPYFFSKINLYNSLGALSLVEEKSEHIKKTGKASNHLLTGEKITEEIKSSENNFGVLLVRFLQLSPKVTDRVIFRIKEVGEKKWYYENTYNANQFQPNQYFTFGFPVITDSKNKIYVFEVMSLAGTDKNGISLSPKKPQVALVYKLTKKNLMSVNVFSLILKKFTYVFNNVNIWQHWPILISAFFIYFMKKGEIMFTLQAGKQAKKKRGQLENSTIMRKLTNQFIATQFYAVFLNTTMKKRLALGLLLFLLAFLYRFSATLVDQLGLYPFYTSLGNGVGVNSFYALLGNGGDYDQFIRAATCAVRNFCPAILGQNFLIESSILGIFYEIFGFVGGLKAYLYLMIILSSIVATLPYVLLSRKNFFTIGGIIGSLFLATSDYLTHMAINLPPDNLSVFFFSMFYIVYLLTMNYGTIRWLLLFGLMGTIDGLNKLLLLMNDLAVFILFIPIFLLEKAKKRTKFPFVTVNPKLIFYSILPFLIFLVMYSIWEYIVQVRFSTPYYFRALLEGGSTYASSTDAGSVSINESLSQGNILKILFYYEGLSIVMIKRLIEYAHLTTLFLTPIFIGLLFFTFRKSKYSITKLLSVVVFASLCLATLELFRSNYLDIQEVGMFAYVWSNSIYINIFLFTSILFLFILNVKYSALRLLLPILPYFLMLIILSKTAPWGRMWAHVVVWSIILLSFLIDWMLSNLKKDYALKRIWIGPIILILFVYFYTIPKQSGMIAQLHSGIINTRSEVTYLRWVNSVLPKEAIILAGGKSDLVTVAQNVNKPIIYNTQWTGALLIKNPNEIPGVSPSDWNIVNELQNRNNFKKNKYLILEDDIYVWRNRMARIDDNLFATSSAALLHADDYAIKVYKFNLALHEGLYELIFR